MSYGVQNNDDAAVGFGTCWVPYKAFQGFVGVNGPGAFTGAGIGNTPVPEAVLAGTVGGGTELHGIPVTAADEWTHLMPISNEWDMTSDIWARLFFFNENDTTTAADVYAFTFNHTFYADGDVLTNVGTAQDQAIVVNHTVANAIDTLEVTAWHSLQTTADYATTDAFWAWSIVATTVGGTADEPVFFGVELRFARNLLTGGNSYAA